MQRFLTPWLTVVSLAIAALTFVISYVSTVDMFAFLGVLGVIWTTAVFVASVRSLITTWRGDGSIWSIAAWSFCAVLFLYLGMSVLFDDSRYGLQFTGLSWLQMYGLVGVVVGLTIGVLEIKYRYSARFKGCPDCDEDVRVAAKVCKFCAYRWPTDSAAEVEVSATA
jgi:hypothetical protein